MKIPLSLFELALVAVISAGVGAGIHSGYISHEIDKCHTTAEQLGNSEVAKSFEFAKCMSPRRYDPLYYYKKHSGK